MRYYVSGINYLTLVFQAIPKKLERLVKVYKLKQIFPGIYKFQETETFKSKRWARFCFYFYQPKV